MVAGRSPEDAYPVRVLSQRVAATVNTWPAVWVEGQIAQISGDRGYRYITLRDADAEVSVSVRASASTVRDGLVERGHAVVARLRPEYYPRNGSLTWFAVEFRPVGVGALMQRIEQLRKTLAAEGLFRAEHKRPLPFLPRRIGLICGRASAAQHDVEVNARRQWPGAVFEVREVPVTGPGAVPAITAALANLDAIADVDVIVITRGGGSFEDLLPFYNEALVRAVFAAVTPVVSAIGHEEDHPLLDDVADWRASTPTAAGKRVVPDLAQEQHTLSVSTSRLRGAIRAHLHREAAGVARLRRSPVLASPAGMLREQRLTVDRDRATLRHRLAESLTAQRHTLARLRGHPAVAEPQGWLTPRRDDVAARHAALRAAVRGHLQQQRHHVDLLAGQLRTLSPQHTLDRGYAVVRSADGTVVRDAAAVSPGQGLSVRVAAGGFAVTVTDSGAAGRRKEHP